MLTHLDFNKVFLPSKMEGYKTSLLADFKSNAKYQKLVDILFFPELGIKQWVSDLQVTNFYNWAYKGPVFKGGYSTLEALGQIDVETYFPGVFLNSSTFFSQTYAESLEDLTSKQSAHYYLYHKNFVHILDSFFLKLLKDNHGYEEKKAGFVEKWIGEDVCFQFHTKRRDFHFLDISGYWYPEFSILIGSERCYISNTTDISTFLFLPSNSFLFFYLNSHDFERGESGQIISVKRKTDEPVICHLKDKNILSLTNSIENKEKYMKYILSTTMLMEHYFSVFEEWFCKHVLPDIQK